MLEVGRYLKDIVIKNDEDQDVNIGDLLKKVTLIVNIDCNVGAGANMECEDLQEVYLRYRHLGFEILAFPCDQFQLSLNESPLTAREIKEDLIKRFNVNFPVMHKVNVNGPAAHPLFLFLQKRLSGFPVDVIKWDFTKFLIVDGEPAKRYAPTTSVLSIEPEIAEALGAPWDSDAPLAADATDITSYMQDVQETKLSSRLQPQQQATTEPNLHTQGVESGSFMDEQYPREIETKPRDVTETTEPVDTPLAPMENIGGKMYYTKSGLESQDADEAFRSQIQGHTETPLQMQAQQPGYHETDVRDDATGVTSKEADLEGTKISDSEKRVEQGLSKDVDPQSIGLESEKVDKGVEKDTHQRHHKHKHKKDRKHHREENVGDVQTTEHPTTTTVD